MAQVAVRIGGYPYTVGCQDGEEAHLRAMAARVDETVAAVKATGGQGGEARLLMMAALLLADRIHDLEAGEGTKPAAAAPADPALAERLARAAEAAERIAADLERA
jgi:cell division protein ZapA